MLLRFIPKFRKIPINRRSFSDDIRSKWNVKHVNPIQRTMDILRGDLKGIFGRDNKAGEDNDKEFNQQLDSFIGGGNEKPFQTHCDVLVIGGGGIGSSIAYWLKKEARQGLNVVVVEKDPMVSGFVLSYFCD